MTSVVTPETLSKTKCLKTFIRVGRIKIFFFQPQTTEYFFWGLWLVQLVALNEQSRSLLLWAAMLYGTYQKLSHTQNASTLGLATQLKIKHRVSGLEIRVNFMAKLEGCMSLNTPWQAIYDTRTKDLLTNCNNYSDLEHVSGAMRFHRLRLFSPGRLVSPVFCQDIHQSVRIPPPSARTAPVLDEGGLRFVMS